MKIFVDPNINDITELRVLSQSDTSNNVDGVMMSYKNSDVVPRWQGFTKKICEIFPNFTRNYSNSHQFR